MLRLWSKLSGFWKISAVAALAAAFSVPAASPALADPLPPPEITVTCRAEPARVILGSSGTLYLRIEDVPQPPQVGYGESPAGLTIYTINLSWTPGEILTFTQDVPNPGEYPWNTPPFMVNATYNVIDQVTGRLNAFRSKAGLPAPFVGSADVASAPFTANETGTITFNIGEVDIPYQEATDYLINKVPCSVEVVTEIVQLPLYLPLMNANR
jgi:hypothetical protein